MFKSSELKTLLKFTGFGALAGIAADIIILLYNAFAGTWNCLCECFSQRCRIYQIKNEFIGYMLLLFAFLICMTIGFIIGLFIALHDRSNRISKEKIINQKEILKQINYTINLCDHAYKKITDEKQIIQNSDGMKSETKKLITECKEKQSQIIASTEQYKFE